MQIVSAQPSSATRPAARQGPGDDIVFIARQPIFDAASIAIGYELLFRSGGQNQYSASDGCLASSHTISRALHTIGLDEISGKKRIFVNFTRELLLKELYTLLPPGRSVVELLEATVVDDEVIRACEKLRAAGYQLALDDVTYPCKVNPLLQLADYLKIDFRALPREDRRPVIQGLAGVKGKLLAEKVETKEEFDEAVALGCEYVQGYFFAKPELMKGKGLVGVEAIHLQFLRELNRPQLNYARIEELIKLDASLTFKLLRYLNSCSIGARNEIKSVKQALVLLGEEALRKWGALVAATSINRNKPPELLVMCLARARFCERMGMMENLEDRLLDLFLIGLLSGIDALLDQPLQTVVSQLAISDDVRNVLLGQSAAPGDLQRIYTLARACERGAWATVIQACPGMRQTHSEIAMIYYESLTWADQVVATAA
jgi:c-di-GMP-related signal transduction protein